MARLSTVESKQSLDELTEQAKEMKDNKEIIEKLHGLSSAIKNDIHGLRPHETYRVRCDRIKIVAEILKEAANELEAARKFIEENNSEKI